MKVKSLRENSAMMLNTDKFYYLSQFRQKWMVTCFGIFSVISTWVRMQPTHIFAAFGSIGTPHWQHSLKNEILVNCKPCLNKGKPNSNAFGQGIEIFQRIRDWHSSSLLEEMFWWRRSNVLKNIFNSMNLTTLPTSFKIFWFEPHSFSIARVTRYLVFWKILLLDAPTLN